MGKASSSKKVARAARTGGGRTKRGSASLGWPVAMALVVVLGTAGIVYSREQRQPDTSAPRIGDHWHGALGFDICGTFAANLPEPQRDASGIHTHADGLLHIEPSSATATGRNARLGVFFEAIDGLDVSAEEVDLPDQDARRNGMECDGKPAVVRTKIWQSRAPEEQGEIYNGNPSDIRLRDNQLITVAFLPADAEIRKPPSEVALDSASASEPPPTEVPPGLTTTVDPNAPSTTLDPNASSTTSAPPTTSAETTTTTTAG